MNQKQAAPHTSQRHGRRVSHDLSQGAFSSKLRTIAKLGAVSTAAAKILGAKYKKAAVKAIGRNVMRCLLSSDFRKQIRIADARVKNLPRLEPKPVLFHAGFEEGSAAARHLQTGYFSPVQIWEIGSYGPLYDATIKLLAAQFRTEPLTQAAYRTEIGRSLKDGEKGELLHAGNLGGRVVDRSHPKRAQFRSQAEMFLSNGQGTFGSEYEFAVKLVIDHMMDHGAHLYVAVTRDPAETERVLGALMFMPRIPGTGALDTSILDFDREVFSKVSLLGSKAFLRMMCQLNSLVAIEHHTLAFLGVDSVFKGANLGNAIIGCVGDHLRNHGITSVAGIVARSIDFDRLALYGKIHPDYGIGFRTYDRFWIVDGVNASLPVERIQADFALSKGALTYQMVEWVMNGVWDKRTAT